MADLSFESYAPSGEPGYFSRLLFVMLRTGTAVHRACRPKLPRYMRSAPPPAEKIITRV